MFGLSGDALAVFLALVMGAIGLAGGALIAAGWRALVLWVVSAALAFAAILLGFHPQFPAHFIWQLVVASTPMVTIFGVVLSRASRNQVEGGITIAAADPKGPEFEADHDKLSKWNPDTQFGEGLIYISTKSKWCRNKELNIRNVRDEIVQALYHGKVTAWAKDHPDDARDFQIRPMAWSEPQINLDTDYVFFVNYGAAYNLRLSKGEIEGVWPPIVAP